MNSIIQESNICHMQNFVDGTWMYLVHQDTPSMPSFLVNYWRHDIAPSTLPETNETSKWSRWRRDPQMMSPDSTYTVKKRRPLILGSHCQKERVFKPRFFPRNMLLFDLFGGITIFQTPHGFSIVILYMQAYKWTQIRTTRIHGLLSFKSRNLENATRPVFVEHPLLVFEA